MAHPIFSDGWAKACAQQLNDREGYRRAAATWEGSVVLLMTGDPPEAVERERRVLLDLWSGGCREARTAVPSDEEPARYVMAGSAATWAQVLTGRLAPLLALITGRLKLVKGSLAELLPHATLAQELVAAAREVDVEDWGEFEK